MSLIIVREPETVQAVTAGELEPGTWFLDHEGEIFGVVLDDRANERRVVSVGDYCRPFIAANPIHNFKVGRVLKPGTLLTIASTATFAEDVVMVPGSENSFGEKTSTFVSERLTTNQAARLLCVAPGTLTNWRSQGVGPSFIKHRHSVFYLKSEIEAYIREHFGEYTSTAEWKDETG